MAYVHRDSDAATYPIFRDHRVAQFTQHPRRGASKATLDLIEKAESTEHYRALRLNFAGVRAADAFDRLHDPQTVDDRRRRQDLIDYFNHYELVAIGIHHGILDDAIYREWMQSHIVMEWNAAAGFVQNERWRLNLAKDDHEYRAEIFGNLQRAVCRWSKQAKRLSVSYSPKPALPTGPVAPGDIPLPDVEPIDTGQ